MTYETGQEVPLMPFWVTRLVYVEAVVVVVGTVKMLVPWLICVKV